MLMFPLLNVCQRKICFETFKNLALDILTLTILIRTLGS
jgi:hypothetical protein